MTAIAQEWTSSILAAAAIGAAFAMAMVGSWA
jgi:hypothetical protein